MPGLTLATLPVVDMAPEPFAVLLLTALAGGAFGAAIGALPSFIFTGFVVLIGESLTLLPGDLPVSLTNAIGFGPIVGPHIAFAGGVAASAYAGTRYPELAPDGWDYHFGKNIQYAFGTKPDVLAVGAVFGALGMLIAKVVTALGIPTDNIAVAVVATALIARPVFGYPIVGSPSGSGLLDMGPFERDEPHPAADGGAAEHAGRPATEPWLPQQYTWTGVTLIGAIFGVLAGFLWLQTDSVFLGYGLSAASLVFLQFDVPNFPVTHHITLLGAVGGVLGFSVFASPLLAVVAAGCFGVLSALVGECGQRLLYSHSGTHVDPPAMAIATLMLVIGGAFQLGLLPTSSYLGL